MCSLPLLSLLLPVHALPDSGQIKKYLNPIHEKSYTNEKQDRIIKKKSFKVTEIEGIQPISNKNMGLFASLDLSKLENTTYIEHLLANENVNGLSVLLPWRDVEPEEDNFHWQTINELLAACAKHNKQLILRISTCGVDEPVQKTAGKGKPPSARSDTPQWVFDAGVKSIAYKGKDGQEHLMPIFWDEVYLAKWSNFVNELGKLYDKHPHLHSIGITGGGILGGTNVMPAFQNDKEVKADLAEKLKTTYGMNPRQLVNHWKYVADVFPKAFPKQHLNFDLDPPTADRKGQDCLDEISDYLVYRYGERVYLTRQDITNDKRGFDQYRLMLKFKNDSLSGYQITPAVEQEANKVSLPKIAKNAFDDGLSFAEIPAAFFDNQNEAMKEWLKQMRLHLGCQIVLQELSLSSPVAAGQPLHVQFVFLNTGAASPKLPMRELDKDVPTSYKLQLSIKNAQGKTVALLLRTPPTPTTDWLGNKPISWEEDLKMPGLKPGKYDLSLAITDRPGGEKLNFISVLNGKTSPPGNDLPIGSIEIK